MQVTNINKIIIFHTRNELLKVQISSIICIEADGNYCNLVLDSNRKHLLCINLASFQKLLEEQLRGDAFIFIRLGKSLIINREYIQYINMQKQKLVLEESRFGERFEYTVSKDALKGLKQIILSVYQEIE